jgi:hypothetical protein
MGSNQSTGFSETGINSRGIIRTSASGSGSERLSIPLANDMGVQNEMHCTIVAGWKAIEILAGQRQRFASLLNAS